MYGVSVDPFDTNRPDMGKITCDEKCNKDKGCFGSASNQCQECALQYYTVTDSK